MDLIVDTNALSSLAEASTKLVEVVAKASMLIIPVIVLGEYRFGINQSTKRTRYESWLSEFSNACRTLSIDDDTASYYASIRLELKQKGRPIPMNDVWIAALCRQHRTTLLSRDRHFDAVAGLKRIDW